MAQLTLSERSQMANNGYFQNRLRAALKKTANYWLNSTQDNNTAVFKRKRFAKDIQNGAMPDMRAYAEYFLTQYNEDPPVFDTGDASQLADSALTDSPATPVAYDFFAGVEAKDL